MQKGAEKSRGVCLPARQSGSRRSGPAVLPEIKIKKCGHNSFLSNHSRLHAKWVIRKILGPRNSEPETVATKQQQQFTDVLNIFLEWKKKYSESIAQVVISITGLGIEKSAALNLSLVHFAPLCFSVQPVKCFCSEKIWLFAKGSLLVVNDCYLEARSSWRRHVCLFVCAIFVLFFPTYRILAQKRVFAGRWNTDESKKASNDIKVASSRDCLSLTLEVTILCSSFFAIVILTISSLSILFDYRFKTSSCLFAVNSSVLLSPLNRTISSLPCCQGESDWVILKCELFNSERIWNRFELSHYNLRRDWKKNTSPSDYRVSNKHLRWPETQQWLGGYIYTIQPRLNNSKVKCWNCDTKNELAPLYCLERSSA